MDFVLKGRSHSLTTEQVERRLRGVVPEPVQTHGVRVAGTVYPVKQAFSVATGLAREDFTSHTARRLLGRLALPLTGPSPMPQSAEPQEGTSKPPLAPTNGRAWPWEGEVQALFGRWLSEYGWTITGMADTATKAHGVDILASKGLRRLGAEVKGWPSKGYADPRRADEVKRTQPTTQAGHWYSQALMKALMLLDSHPDHESLVVLPDYPRFRDLARRTTRGRIAAGVHVVFVKESGDSESDTWTA